LDHLPIAFFLSPVLDNLTTAITTILLIRKLMTHREDRLFFLALLTYLAGWMNTTLKD